MYQAIGEQLPLLAQYQALFQANPYMRRVLELIYWDILEFHTKALKYFKQKGMLRIVFCYKVGTKILSSVETTFSCNMENFSDTIFWNSRQFEASQATRRESSKLNTV
jgi:hypothetical protein